jgi:hypothetical protein
LAATGRSWSERAQNNPAGQEAKTEKQPSDRRSGSRRAPPQGAPAEKHGISIGAGWSERKIEKQPWSKGRPKSVKKFEK